MTGGLARAAERVLPSLLALMLVALMLSITAISVLAVLLVLAMVVRLTDPAVRARYRWPLAVSLSAFVVISAVSAVVSTEPNKSLLALRPLYLAALFYVAVNEFRSAAAIRRALNGFFLAVALASVWGMLQVLVCTTSVDVPEFVAWALRIRLERCRAPSIEPFRAKGFFSIYMTLGGSLVVAVALLAGMFAFPRVRRTGPAIAAAVTGSVALALTYVRNAWLGALAAVLVVAGLSRRWLLLAPLAAALVVAVVAPTPLRGKLASIVDTSSPSASERLYMWRSGARMIRDAPWLGLGPGGVKRHYRRYKDPAARRPGTSHLHNNLIQIAAERGLIGLSAWLTIWIAFLVRAGAIYRALPAARTDDRALVAGSLAAVVGVFLAGLFEYNFGDSEVIALVWMVMAFPFVIERELADDRAAGDASLQ